jgi:hypothetical protein
MAAPASKRDQEVPLHASPVESTHDQIAALAYALWHERGCPYGSPEVDWLKAERTLRPSAHTDPSVGATEDDVNMRATVPQRIDHHGSKVEDIAGTGEQDAQPATAFPLSLLRHRSRVPEAADLLD